MDICFNVETYLNFFSNLPAQCWTMNSPLHYKWNWQCNFRQKRVISYSCLTLWQWVFQRCDTLAYLKCNYSLFTVHERNSSTIHLIFSNFIFDYCSLFSRSPIVRFVQRDCYFSVYCGICANFYFFSYMPIISKSVSVCIDLFKRFGKSKIFTSSKMWVFI